MVWSEWGQSICLVWAGAHGDVLSGYLAISGADCGPPCLRGKSPLSLMSHQCPQLLLLSLCVKPFCRVGEARVVSLWLVAELRAAAIRNLGCFWDTT